MEKEILIVSLRDREELADDAIRFANEKWPFISKYYVECVRETLAGKDGLPLAFVLLKQGKIIGFFVLEEQDVVQRKDLTPWISLIFVEEEERGNSLVKDILQHGRRVAKELGYDKLYLSTHLLHLYDKYGFQEIGMDLFEWGRPCRLYESSTTVQEKGQIVFLNGVSSSGKTTLALELQKKMKEPCFLISQDIFRQMWGQKYNEDSGENLYNVTMSMMYKTIRMFSEEHKNVIVDSLIFTDEFLNSDHGEGTLKDAVEILHSCPVVFVHVTCDLDALRVREIERGDRKIGHAESQLSYLWPQEGYDLTINTHTMTAGQAVESILNALEHIDDQRSFHELHQKMRQQ